MCGVSSYGIFEQWNAKKRGSTVYYLPRCLRRGSGLCAGPDGRRAIYHVQRNAAEFFEGGGGLKRRDNNDREEPCFHTRPRRGGRVWAWSRPDKNAHFCFVCVRVCGGGGRRPTHARTHAQTGASQRTRTDGRGRARTNTRTTSTKDVGSGGPVVRGERQGNARFPVRGQAKGRDTL